jgi:microcystin-dependent protein
LNKTAAKFQGLFNVIGTIYGGDANPNFNLPDYRGLFLRCVDAGRGIDPDISGRKASGGSPALNQVGSTQPDAFASHAHTVTGFHLQGDSGSGFDGTGLDTNSDRSGPFQHNVTTSSEGESKETRPKNIYVNYIIAL